jgi:hypothetical protein
MTLVSLNNSFMHNKDRLRGMAFDKDSKEVDTAIKLPLCQCRPLCGNSYINALDTGDISYPYTH